MATRNPVNWDNHHPWWCRILSINSMVNTLPETNESHLKMDGWNTIVTFWDGLFSGANCWLQGGYPIIYRVSYMSGGCLGFLNHQH